MSHRKFSHSFPWMRYSKKLTHKIENPRHCGFFTPAEARERGMRLATGREGRREDGNTICLYLLVDESDGVIADARFQVLGQSALIGAAEAACELLIRKNYDQALRLTAELIDKQVRDRNEVLAFPEETYPHLNLVLDAIEKAAEQCLDIPFAENDLPSPIAAHGHEGGQIYPGWDTLSKEQKIEAIEGVIAADIRPYIELDAGGIQIVDLVQDQELIIAYEGACTTCHSSTGATLNAIQEILKLKIHPALRVVPDLTFLSNETVQP